ncbi:hypothetical protein GCM10009550_72340 [Actinocorallia libanotica]|uniref:Uncharacterized protein n=1 Tax=Actinocorallia libanotica TaxID=46162 RepID=A0ABN1RYM6_9ACTN
MDGRESLSLPRGIGAPVTQTGQVTRRTLEVPYRSPRKTGEEMYILPGCGQCSCSDESQKVDVGLHTVTIKD